MKAEQLNRKAKENLNRYFKEREMVVEEKSEDILLNQQQIEKQINKDVKQLNSLEVLRKQLNEEAKKAQSQYFEEEKEEEIIKIKSKEEAYLDLLDNQYRQYKLVNQLKMNH